MYIFFKKSIILSISMFLTIALPQLSLNLSEKIVYKIRDLFLLDIFFNDSHISIWEIVYKNMNILSIILFFLSMISLIYLLNNIKKFILSYFIIINILIFISYFSLSVISLHGIYEVYFSYIICFIAILVLEYYYSFLKIKLIG